MGTTNGLLDISDVEAQLGRKLENVELVRAEQALDAVVHLMQGWLNRLLWPQEVIDEKHWLAYEGPLMPYWGPIRSMSSLRIGSTGTQTTQFNDTYDVYPFPPKTPIWITYEAGDDTDDPRIIPVKQLAVESVIRGVVAGPQVQYNVISSYSVEGTSITYNSPQTQQGSVGKLSVADLNSIRFLKRVRVR